MPKDCPATPKECRTVAELAWLSDAGVADALLREGNFREAQRLYERLAANCPSSLHACRTREIYLDLASAAERAGDFGMARSARMVHARGKEGGASDYRADDLRDMVRTATGLRGPLDPRFDVANAERVLLSAIESARTTGYVVLADGEQLSSWSLRRALMNLFLASGRAEQALAVMPTGTGGDSTLIADDLERWGQFPAAERLRRDELARHRADAAASTVPGVHYALALELDALARNLHAQRRYEEAARLYFEALPTHRSVLMDYDPELQRRIDIAAGSFSAYRDGWPEARRLYLEAMRAHLHRQAYLRTATHAQNVERREAVPMFRKMIRNSWNLSR